MKHLIFFDSHCGLCQQSVIKILQIDTSHLFSFAPLIGKTSDKELQGTFRHLKNLNTLVLFENYHSHRQKIWIKGKAVFRIFWLIGGKWKMLGWLYFLPLGLDFFYSIIARHRKYLGISEIEIPVKDKKTLSSLNNCAQHLFL